MHVDRKPVEFFLNFFRATLRSICPSCPADMEEGPMADDGPDMTLVDLLLASMVMGDTFEVAACLEALGASTPAASNLHSWDRASLLDLRARCAGPLAVGEREATAWQEEGVGASHRWADLDGADLRDFMVG